MNRIAALALVASCALPAVALADPPREKYIEAADQTLPPPPADQAQVVFLQPSDFMKWDFVAMLFEVVDGKRQPLVATGSHSKTVLNFAPGHHLLMSNFGYTPSNFFEMNVEAGKRYYVLERFIFGHGFQLRPLRPEGTSNYTVRNPDFPGWLANTRLYERMTVTEAWFEKHAADVDKYQAKGWKEWQGKSAEQRAELTLNADDAVAP